CENRVQQVAFDGPALELGCLQFGMDWRTLTGVGDCTVIFDEVFRRETGARRRVGRTEPRLPAAQVGLKENNPRLFRLAIASATAGDSAEIPWQRIHLRAIIQYPPFVVME